MEYFEYQRVKCVFMSLICYRYVIYMLYQCVLKNIKGGIWCAAFISGVIYSLFRFR